MRPSRSAGRLAPPRSSLLVAAIVALISAPLAPPPLLAQDAGAADDPSAGLTLETIMADPSWIGALPLDPFWSADGRWVYYEEERWSDGVRDLVRVDPRDGTSTPVDDAARAEVEPAGPRALERPLLAFLRGGDLFVKNLESGAVRQLTRTAALETQPLFLVGGDAIAFRRGDAFFVRALDGSGLERQPFELRLEDDPEIAESAEDGYLDRQQERLFDAVREEKDRRRTARDTEAARRRADPTRAPPPIYLGAEVELVRGVLSPTARHAALVLADETRDEGRADQMPVWVTEDGYVEVREVRPKVGTDDEWGHRLTLLDAASGDLHEIDLSTLPGRMDDPLQDLRLQAERRAAERRAQNAADEDGRHEDATATDHEDDADVADGADDGPSSADEPTPRPIEIEDPPVWSPDGRHLAVAAHSRDNKDRWIVLVTVDPSADTAPTLDVVDRLSLPEGWINWSFNELGWLPDGRLWFLSEATDRSQLYLHDPRDGSTRRLTPDRGVVSRPTVAPPRTSPAGAEPVWIYYVANTTDAPYDYDVHRVSIPPRGATAEPTIERLTAAGGLVEYALAPAGDRLLLSQSTSLRPPQLFVQDAAPGAEARQITDTVSDAFEAIDWVEPAIVPVPSTHQDRPVWSRVYAPRDPERLRGDDGTLPAVVFVHGAGYLQNAHAGWSTYFREFMFHSLLSERGYVVLDMDYRGSAGYGAAWRTAIYRQMGTPELEDLTDGVAWLTREHAVDPERVGVYGGSYGGFLTMMALFKQPELFACGAALRPVTDWAHYNHPYTSNILNSPEIDPEAYERSSPIELAAGLDDPLLIAAPMLDDNVFFLDTVRLAQRLIELEKEDWEVAIYPVEPHGFRRPSSWLDEYRRIFKLFERHLASSNGSDLCYHQHTNAR